MEALYQNFEEQLRKTTLDFKRYLYPSINWDSRMFGIVGPRGVGKTTLVLQYIKENRSISDTLYVSMDDLYFANHTLHETADKFYKNGGKYLFIDEIHKYPEWSRTLKNLYDNYSDLKVVFTGSSILDILKGYADLSRRALVSYLQGLSFREYLQFFHGITVPVLSLQDILAHKNGDLKPVIGYPIKYFKEYLQRGYYPFGNDEDYVAHLKQIITQTMESDIPVYANMNVATGRKLLKLLAIIADSVPFKPNFSGLSKLIEVSKNNIADYFYYIEKAGMIAQLREKTESFLVVGKVEKVYLDNTNLAFCLSEKAPDTGNLRETVFFNQMRINNKIYRSDKGDFNINNLTFEVGGKSKTQKQIEGLKNAYIVKDDIEYGYQNVLPLWAFGLNY
ncbi:MAG: AAA family ATPase [Dysgonamonadaceae bacterium]|jgi:predicted AAA+ superfamily ATPase|nr:AAA family ATPase [Dysgonamonadaceae bacterium]